MKTLFVAGRPIPQGSMRTIRSKSTGRDVTIHQNAKELRAWRKLVKDAALEAGIVVTQDPVAVSLDFDLEPRSRSRSMEVVWAATKPDIDKLTRAVLDALTGVAYVDDAQVCVLRVTKRWCAMHSPGVRITIDTWKDN